MKHLLKNILLLFVVTQLVISCGGNSDKKEKDKLEADSVKALNKDDEVDPTTGCD
ncbi:hypothetical protein [Sphingobacterium phlebotomi]|uniref:hypothetical protein n=1 Tax=Sphingobacterium phlebotomi TaxID=2605433 RepID=UPI0016535651|nr:hypothetical protein [Sphingobacterium phlebotomi]